MAKQNEGKHSDVIRGLRAAGKNQIPVGDDHRFGRMFPGLDAAKFGKSAAQQERNLEKLADAMVSGFDKPKDGPDSEESGIPSLYTYFGQFIDHDLTFDPEASFQKQKDPKATEDFRTAAFDLDNVYGRGPGDQPYMYDSDGVSFTLGSPIIGGHVKAHDLQRNPAGRALIGDPRNDENSIVSQLQGLFLQFHNRVVREHSRRGKADFVAIQKIVRRHYQYLVINDFLPRIVNAKVLNTLKTKGMYDPKKMTLYKNVKYPFMPVEFSVAGYRLGHSMVRPGYRLNDVVLVPIFPLPPKDQPGFGEGLTGFKPMNADWAIDWGRFIDIDVRPYGSMKDADAGILNVENMRRLQFAYRIDTALVDPLRHLPPIIASKPSSLAFRNLRRGAEFGLPSGQAVAGAFKVPVMKDRDILIGQGVDHPKPRLHDIVNVAGPVFKDNCPLWTYVLAEAMHYQKKEKIPVKGHKTVTTPQLGPVGGRIVATVFLGLMFADSHSYLSEEPNWKPSGAKPYTLKDFVRFATGQS
jgi:Animal haem peroxidase